MNRKIYKEMAKKYGITVDELKRDMQDAINATYLQPSSAAQGINRKGDIPTVDEFICHAVSELKGKEGNQEPNITADNDKINDTLKRQIMDLYADIGSVVFADEAALAEFRHRDFSDLHEYHFGLGMYLRSNVLTADSSLYKAFKGNGINHPDDMSAVVIRIWHMALQQTNQNKSNNDKKGGG